MDGSEIVDFVSNPWVLWPLGIVSYVFVAIVVAIVAYLVFGSDGDPFEPTNPGVQGLFWPITLPFWLLGLVFVCFFVIPCVLLHKLAEKVNWFITIKSEKWKSRSK